MMNPNEYRATQPVTRQSETRSTIVTPWYEYKNGEVRRGPDLLLCDRISKVLKMPDRETRVRFHLRTRRPSDGDEYTAVEMRMGFNRDIDMWEPIYRLPGQEGGTHNALHDRDGQTHNFTGEFDGELASLGPLLTRRWRTIWVRVESD